MRTLCDDHGSDDVIVLSSVRRPTDMKKLNINKEIGEVADREEQADAASGVVGGFKQRLYQLRRDRGWSQSELARRVWGETTDARGYTVAKNRDRVSAYESGKAIPERTNLEALASALGVSMEELAPDLILTRHKAAVQPAAFEMQIVGGEAHLKMDAMVPLSVAVQIVALLEKVALGR